jgi:trans-2,3-dihydro-3-hydroxyanthranilate isomerase
MSDFTRRQFGQLMTAAAVPVFAQAPQERRYKYLHLDVFTDRAFTGNQLFVFLQPQGLAVETMHALTRESNLSECTFVFPPEQAGTDHRVRIFTRNGETPFAGHPTIGTAFALANAGTIKAGTARTVFGLGAGPTLIDFEWEGPRLKFAWMTQQKPTFGKTIPDAASLAAALGVDAAALAVSNAPPQEVYSGSTFIIVPMTTRKAVDAAVLDRSKMDQVLTAAGVPRRGIYIFTTEAATDGADAYSRLLGGAGAIEDPATGSAAGPAGCFAIKYGFVPMTKSQHVVFLQGVLVGRPSRIHVNVSASDGASRDVTGVKVGGQSVVVGEGSVTV